MIRHIVVFNLKPEVETEDRDWLFRQIESLAKIPSVRELTIGKRLEAREEWYRERPAPEYGWAFSMQFDDEDGLYVYQKNPDHERVAAEIRKRVSNIKIFDFVSPAP